VSTPYHSLYFAHELVRRSASNSIEKLGASLVSARVDLNPHQLDAALFAFRSPLSRGALLADEVGLGKTIEAGLIISQLWAEHKRRILIIAPTILRKQWAQELDEKFYIPSFVMDTREYNTRRRSNPHSPLLVPNCALICSYQFVRAREAEFAAVPWDLVVVDEAHRLRNVWKSGNKVATGIKQAITGRPKLLLTATPLQNSLLELYGLVSFLDEHIFGDIGAFRARYMRGPMEERQLDELRQRLRPICQRTLRRQVTEYVRFTRRIPLTQDFTPTQEEQSLYDLVTSYLQRETLNALPVAQRKLMTLVLRKLLASSTFAIAGTFASLANRLKEQQLKLNFSTMEEDFETLREVAEEWPDDAGETDSGPEMPMDASVASEIRDLTAFGDLAGSISVNAKGEALLLALGQGFNKLAELGARRKAVIFTESRRTQTYLLELLSGNGYDGQILTINGTNGDDRSGAIYRDWVESHRGEPVVTGNKTVDLRAALVEYFRDKAEIMIATEAAAEGVNLQFCSLVVNYDLPWNPQRIEQRIGRCHRYGQKHDVVVINFLNRGNAADQRVFELLSQKFQLFDGIFGSSDEVLGALESGVDFESRIAGIYQECRSPEEIDLAFNSLQRELEEQISARLEETRSALLEHFDEEVHERLRVNLQVSRDYLNRMESCFWNLTRHELQGVAEFDEERREFTLFQTPEGWPSDVHPGRYHLVTRARQDGVGEPYRLGHPLAQAALDQAKDRHLPCAQVNFSYSTHPGSIGLVRELQGSSGWLSLNRLTVRSLDDEDRLLFAGVDDSGTVVHADACERLFRVSGQSCETAPPSPEAASALSHRVADLRAQALHEIQQRNARFFEEEIEKLDRWADDLKHGLEMELKDLDIQIKTTRREAQRAPDLQSKLTLHRTIKDLETLRSRKRRQLYEAQDTIDAQKEALIAQVEAQMEQEVEMTELFLIRWNVQ